MKKEAAARDISARGIADQIRKGWESKAAFVLDVSEVPDDQVPL